MKKRFNKFLTLLAVLLLGIGQMWATETILATFRISLTSAPTEKYASYSDDDATYTCNKVGSNSSSNYALVGTQYYMKLTANDAYVKIKLKSGSIAVGDKVYVYHNHTSNKNGVGFAMTSGGTNGATGNATANTELKLEYTLTASDIAADGSISVYRQGSNLYVGKIEVAHPEPECTKPGTPGSLQVDSKTYNSASFSWSAAANSDGYKVYVEKKSDKSKILDWTTCATTSYTATGLAAETEYTFKVKAIGATGYCDFGDEATIDVTTNAAPAACPAGLTISGTAAYTEGETIELTAAVTEGNGEITYTWYKGEDLAAAKAAGAIGTGASFSKATCATSDAGNYWCVATKDACSDAESTAYAVTVDALVACATLIPAISGDAPSAGDAISLATATGGSMKALTENLSYTENGLLFGSSSSTKAEVTLNHLMQVGTVITATIYNDNNDKNRGLNLLNSSGTSKATWTKNMIGDHVETYTVVAGDGLAGSNVFQLQRNNNAYLKSISVSNCGAELLALSSAVSVAGKATVTLSKSLVEAGGSATASYSDIDAAYDFDGWEITSGDATIADATAATAAITMGSTDAVITLKLKAASVKHTVTYYDDVTELGTELVVEGSNPTATGIVAPHKLGYTFDGWSTTNGGAAVALNTISVAADMPLYAVYSEINCAALSGTIFSLAMDVAPAANCTIKTASGYDGSVDLVKYATISGGIAMAENSSTNNHLIITTDPLIRFTGGSGYVHISFDCALKVGDKIKTTISNQNIAYTTTSTRSTTNYFTKGTDQELTITEGHPLENAAEMYLWAASSSDGRLSSLQVIRPEKYAVTFNMHDHGDAVDPQYIVEGGKVTEPATASITGWDFGGWYKESTFENAWDFANDVVGTSAIELHAKWTEHVLSSDVALGTLSVNGEAITIVPSQTVYNVELPMGTSAIPTVAATAHDANAKACTVTQATAVDGSATVYIKAEDNTTEATYTINFSVATSKDIELVWNKSYDRCDATKPDANVLIAAMSQYLSASYTGSASEGGSLSTGKTTGSKIIITAKPGYAFKSMGFYGKIEDGTCNFYNDGVVETIGTSTSDACYADVFSNDEVHEFVIELTGSNGVYIRNMQLTMIEACTPITLAWDEEPVEFEVGKAGYAIAATANNSGTVAYSSNNAIIDVVAATGELTINGLGSATLKAATAEGDGSTYCKNGGADIEISKTVNTYYLVQFDPQNETAVVPVKYYSGDDAIALPSAPTYSGFDFQGWFNAPTGGTQYTEAITPAASMTVYAQWVAQCDGPSITVQPASANYLTGRTAAALACTATAGAAGELTYTWYSCDDDARTNPVELAGAPTPSTAVAGTFYFYCAVTEAGCDVVRNSDVATITVADKDGICIIKVATTGGTNKTVTGLYAEDGVVNIASDKKFGGSGQYIGMMLQEGKTFDEGDIINVHTTTAAGQGTIAIYSNSGKTATQIYDFATMGVTGNNKFALPAAVEDMSTLYVCRTDADNWNGYVDYIEVTRACAPILNKITVNGVEGAPVANVVTIEVPASTTQSQLEAIAFDWVSNDDDWTAANAPVAANAWEFGVANEVTFTDKDGDQSVYTITVNKAVPSSDATLSALSASAGVLSPAFDPAVLSYTVALPYGTSEVPTLSATKNHVGAAEPVINNAAAFVNRKAVSTVTVTAENGTTELTYTVTFNVEKFPSIVIWDGSTMSAVAESPTSGFTWAVTGFGTIANYSATCGTKAYTKCLPSGGSASASRNIALNVPEGYLAKFYIVFGSHSDSEESRGMFIGSTATKTLDESSVLTLYSPNRSTLAAGTSELVLGEGTWYINPMKSVDFYEISATLMPVGYQRNVTEGRMGTVCLPANVEAGYIYGAEVYTLLYWKYGTSYADCQMVDFGEVEEMQAGYPYMIIPTGNKFAVVYGDETYDGDGVHMANGFIGTINPIAAAPDNVLVGKYGIINNMVQKLGTNCNSPANRAYIDLSETPSKETYEATLSPSSAPKKRISLGHQGTQETTGLDEINVNTEKIEKVMVDGQMFIIRGGHIFDATGRLVK